MSDRTPPAAVPREVIRVTAYAHLELYLSKFARGELGLVLLLGRHGTGKWKTQGGINEVRGALGIAS